MVKDFHGCKVKEKSIALIRTYYTCIIKKDRTHLEDILYAVNLYFDGLSLRKTVKALSQFVKRSHTAIRDWIHKYQPGGYHQRQRKSTNTLDLLRN